jgi:hypothetical protein
MDGDSTSQASYAELEALTYHPKRQGTPLGWFVVMISMGISGLALGYIGSLARPWIPTVAAVLPLVGLLAGLVGVLVGRWFRVRSLASGGLAGLVAGVAAVYALDIRVSPASGMPPTWVQASAAPAQPGAAPSRRDTGRESRGARVGQIGMVAAIAGLLVVRASRKPFCATCGSWKTTHFLGSVEASPERAVQAFTSGSIRQIAELNPMTGLREISVFLTSCDRCGPASPCEVRVEQRRPGRDHGHVLADLSYPGEAVRLLPRLFTRWIEGQVYADVAATAAVADAPTGRNARAAPRAT